MRRSRAAARTATALALVTAPLVLAQAAQAVELHDDSATKEGLKEVTKSAVDTVRPELPTDAVKTANVPLLG
ncbi:MULTISPECIES: hypothetical protein [Streptomyces]|uniref:Uncharacterized protein n=1 Tax=Streptomyces cacaoi TaxID=1898 RepID=A0A4Y3R9F7_STRCI|nr:MULTISPECIES: hypothetical protein [Streptomyces]NNG89410.1 hypothetical protein [Streptomyces cacaoi]QHF96259.1 hypothetical protein DEH18_23125 [Streptomyces sp. NHF165]GEB54282.1 hypothetical protein SCA03_68330 [Streptomyces cacaoi]